MRVSVKRFLYVGIILSILINNGFFRTLPDSTLLNIVQLLVIIVLNMASWYYYANSGKQFRKKMAFSVKYEIYVLIFILGVQFISECILRGNSISKFISSVSPYLYIFLLVPICILLYATNDLDKIFKKITLFTIINLCIAIFVAVLFDTLGTNINMFEYYQTVATYRNGRLRLSDLDVFLGISTVYLLKTYFVSKERKKKSKALFGLMLVLFACFWVQQTRAIEYTIVFIIALAYTSYVRTDSKKVLIYMLGIGALGIMLISGGFDFLFATFSLNGSKASSSLMRIEEWKYAWEQFKIHPLVGYGVTKLTVPGAIKLNFSGYIYTQTYSHVDIGVVGSTAMLGIPYIGMYVVPIIRFGKTIYKGYGCRKKMLSDYMVFVCLFAFLILTSVTIVVTDGSRVYAWAYYMAAFEYYRWNVESVADNE